MAAGQLLELDVHDLGIIERATVVLGPGMTALTGETGAGKTLIVGALDLLLGGRADPGIVRAGATEAVIEARFLVDGEERILTRAIPRDGRSRAYVDGRMATAAAVAEHARSLIDLHGQHAHQSLLGVGVQRQALDRFGGVDRGPLDDARRRIRELEAARAALGGDAGQRAREADLVRFQLEELASASLADPDEDGALDALEDRLAGAEAHREAAEAVAAALTGDGGALDAVAMALAAVEGRSPYDEAADRLRSVQADLGDIAVEVRTTGEGIELDPARLDQVRARRQLLVDLRRKYGSAPQPDGGDAGAGTLADVLAFEQAAQRRLREIESHDERAEAIDAELAAAREVEARAAATVGRARRAAAGPLASAVEANLAELAMASARFEVLVGDDDPGDEVAFHLAANPGAPAGALAKVASGGELARTMLALRLVLSSAPPVLVFDEVDAGIGGAAALTVGRALAALGRDHQVFVVTHLPQVAAFADAQISIRKEIDGATTTASAHPLDADARIVEVSRMLSGTPESATVRDAAVELLELATTERGR